MQGIMMVSRYYKDGVYMVNRGCLEANMQFEFEDKASQDRFTRDSKVRTSQIMTGKLGHVKSGQVKSAQVQSRLGNLRKSKSGKIFGTG